ncbi:MAG: hypothetical protein AABZ74_08200 [Cyanobacteriota bacterium]
MAGLGLGNLGYSSANDDFMKQIGLKNPNPVKEELSTPSQDNLNLPDLQTEIRTEETLQINTTNGDTPDSVKVESNLPFIDSPLGKITIKNESLLTPEAKIDKPGPIDSLPESNNTKAKQKLDLAITGENYTVSSFHKEHEGNGTSIQYKPFEGSDVSINQEDTFGKERKRVAQVNSDIPIVGKIGLTSSETTTGDGNVSRVNMFNWKFSDNLNLNQERKTGNNEPTVLTTRADYKYSENVSVQAIQVSSLASEITTTENQVKLSINLPSSEDAVKVSGETQKTEAKPKKTLGTQIEIVKGEKRNNETTQNLDVSAIHTFGTEEDPLAVYVQDVTKTGEAENLKVGYKSKNVNSSYENNSTGKTLRAEYVLPESDAVKYFKALEVSRTINPESTRTDSVVLKGNVTDNVEYKLGFQRGTENSNYGSVSYTDGAFKAELGADVKGQVFGAIKYEKEI